MRQSVETERLRSLSNVAVFVPVVVEPGAFKGPDERGVYAGDQAVGPLFQFGRGDFEGTGLPEHGAERAAVDGDFGGFVEGRVV